MYQSEQKEQFDTCSDLLEYYGRKRIVDKTDHLLEKPIQILDVIKLLDKEIKSATLCKVQYILRHFFRNMKIKIFLILQI